MKTKRRKRPKNVKEQIVRQRGYQNIRLLSEDVAEFDYRPTACKKKYRLVVVRKNLQVDDGQGHLFADYDYFFYLTNERELKAHEVVFEANDRCDQENLVAQLKGGVRALTAPVDNLTSNWAYMAMTALAWNLKAWWALWPPEGRGPGRERRAEEKRRVLRMEFKTFINAFLRVPCQVVRSGRRIVCRLLAWNRWQPMFFHVLDHLRRPLRC